MGGSAEAETFAMLDIEEQVISDAAYEDDAAHARTGFWGEFLLGSSSASAGASHLCYGGFAGDRGCTVQRDAQLSRKK